MPMQERRECDRTAMSRPVKLRCMTTGRYFTGMTRDISAGGALVEVDHPSRLLPGQSVRVGIAWRPAQAVLSATAMTPATVVRSLGMGEYAHVALQFKRQPQATALAA